MERTYKYNNSNVTIKFGDILTSKNEIIVSSDDCFVSMGGGVSMSIRRAEGTGAIQKDAMKQIPYSLGDVMVTTAGTLPQKFIFHAITIGFVKETQLKGLSNEQIQELIIKNSVTKCLNLMRSLNVSSIAFPTIGGGTARIPHKRIAHVMARSTSDFFKKTNVAYNIELYIYTGNAAPDYMQYIDFFEQFASHVDYTNIESDSLSQHPKKRGFNNENYDVFISYSRNDSQKTDEIVRALERVNLKCWIDRSGHYSGKNYKSEIVGKIRHSQIVLFVSSENSNKSENVIKEISVAVELQKHIIPIRLDYSSYADSIAYDLIGIDYINYEKEKEDFEIKVLTQISIIRNASIGMD